MLMSHNNSLGGPEILKRRESIAFSNFWLVLVLRSKYKNGREGPGFESDHLLLFESSKTDFEFLIFTMGLIKLRWLRPEFEPNQMHVFYSKKVPKCFFLLILSLNIDWSMKMTNQNKSKSIGL